MTLPLLIALVVGGLALAMVGAWALQRATGNAGWVDVVWTFATGAAGVVYALTPTPGFAPGARAYLTAALVGLWSLRLGLHLAVRTSRSQKEDARYAKFRQEWGSAFRIPAADVPHDPGAGGRHPTGAVLLAARNPAPSLRIWDWLGAAVLLTAIVGEGMADSQLETFKRYPPNRGKICDVGLWSWSRHPNYFFEWMGWLAYPLLAFDPAGSWPWALSLGRAGLHVLSAAVRFRRAADGRGDGEIARR